MPATRPVTIDDITAAIRTYGNIDDAISAAQANEDFPLVDALLVRRQSEREQADPQLKIGRLVTAVRDLMDRSDKMRSCYASEVHRALHCLEIGNIPLAETLTRQATASLHVASALVAEAQAKMDEIDALRPSNVVRLPVRAPTVLTGLVGAMMDIAASGAVLPPCDTEAR